MNIPPNHVVQTYWIRNPGEVSLTLYWPQALRGFLCTTFDYTSVDTHNTWLYKDLYQCHHTAAHVAQVVGHCSGNQKVASLTPGQGTCLGSGLAPVWVRTECTCSTFLSHIEVSLSFSLPSPLSKLLKNRCYHLWQSGSVFSHQHTHCFVLGFCSNALPFLMEFLWCSAHCSQALPIRGGIQLNFTTLSNQVHSNFHKDISGNIFSLVQRF